MEAVNKKQVIIKCNILYSLHIVIILENVPFDILYFCDEMCLYFRILGMFSGPVLQKATFCLKIYVCIAVILGNLYGRFRTQLAMNGALCCLDR